MAASTKAQLGARVSPELREAVVARAKSEGVSLNVWVERTLGAALSGSGGGNDGESKVARAALPKRVPSGDSVPRRAPVASKDNAATWAMDRQAKLNAAKYGGKT